MNVRILKRTPVCAISDNVFNKTPTDPTKQLVYLLRNASSLEAHAGFRFEFLPLHPGGENPARLYFKAEAGFLSLAQSGGDIYDVHHIGLGALSTGGKFAGSYFELGYGRNDVFRLNRYRRGIVDGMLTWGTSRKIRPFVQMVLDSDLGKGADSVQTFMGLSFDLGEIF
jgi:hypothetical protein